MGRVFYSCGRVRRIEQSDEVAAVLILPEDHTALGDRAQHAQQFGRPIGEDDVEFDLLENERAAFERRQLISRQ